MPSTYKERQLYRDLIRGAWEITWHHKGLWILGFFAALLGNGGAIDIIARASQDLAGAGPFSNLVDTFNASLMLFRIGTTGEQAAILLTGILIAAMTALMIVLSISSAAGIMVAAKKAVSRRTVSLREALATGAEHFWPLFLVQIVGRALVVLLLVMTASASLSAARATVTGNIAYLIVFVLFAFSVLIVAFLTNMTNAGVVLQSLSVSGALANAWRLLSKHWLVSLEMILLLFLLNITAVVGIVLAILVLAIPFFLLFLSASVLGSSLGFFVVLFLALVTVFALVAVVGSMLSTFQFSAWTLLYLRLSQRGAVSKLERIVRALRLIKLHAS